ncbi:aminotransferase class V-fold PLP-dependent enzyme [Mastigocoleus sp. MO_188.B34]|uniref:aminotransferase class V-fold PLP-dependent enzyme n=1 Tax=Mastigocoleus sp. MO_188.B34 TaxID=3036635 RepID=UPI002639D2C9|nr:aminotransferase class V-fold PLP-dependent enzyme [Mastigocoleus sp. MO_188.B34]MDJ0693089.1 aminotransferase class V-fold PLP-dependent enzyme [Mastigocoleus sp. MO_188.B34]
MKNMYYPRPNQQLYSHRQQFPALNNKTYFNYGGQGPMPQMAIQGIIQAQTNIQHLGPFGTRVNEWIQQEVAATAATIASELNVAKETITLTENVTSGCNIAMWGINWRSGDRLLLSDCEHPGIIAIAQEISRRFDVQVSICPLMSTLNEGDPVEVITQHLHPRTRLVVLSHVLWNTGQVLPLDKITDVCRSNSQETQILVDAAQSVGMLPLNLAELEVDFYAFTGHKWLCGPGGVGGLYVKPEIRDNLRPTFIGWRGVITDNQCQPIRLQPDGRRYEIATSNYPLYAGLKEAIQVHQEWGTSKERYEQICRNSEYLWYKLTELDNVTCLRTSPPESGLVSFTLDTNQPQASQKLVNYLESQGFLTRTILAPDCVRACVHYFTLESEIDLLITQIQKFQSILG